MDGLAVKRFIKSFSPYRILACCALFFVVRAKGDTDYQVSNVNDESGPITNYERYLSTHSVSHCEKVCENLGSSVNTNQEARSMEQTISNILQDVADFSIDHLSKVTRDADLSIDTGSNHHLNSHSNSHSGDDREPLASLFSDTPIFAPISNRIQNAVCRKHSRIFLHQLKRYKMWALQMYDSSAKLPAGLLRGNANQLGDFDECLAVDAGDVDGSGTAVQGRYCLASLDVTASTPAGDRDSLSQALHSALAYGFIRSKAEDPGHFVPKFTTTNWAFCIPSSCSAQDLELSIADHLQHYNVTSGLAFHVTVDQDMCYVKQAGDNSYTYSLGTILTALFYMTVIVFALVATVRDSGDKLAQHQHRGKLQRILMAFSLRKNLSELLTVASSDGDIPCIHGIRALCTIALYLGHKVVTLCYRPYSNRVALTQMSNEPWGTMFRASQFYTDAFLLLSGVLTSYNLSKEMHRKNCINWRKRYVARFIRLTPALLALVLFYAFIWEHLGDGPMWNMVVKKNADVCKESFWKNILYIQNLFPFENMCATHTYQLALDMQLSMLTPLLVYLLFKHSALGFLALAGLYVISAFVRYYATLNHNLAHMVYHGMEVSQLYRTGNHTYAVSLHRATPYLVGVTLGYILQRTRKSIYIPKFLVFAGWMTTAYFTYLSLVAPSKLGSVDYVYDVQEMADHAVYFPMVAALSMGWVIFACSTGYGGRLNGFLCMRSLVLLGRISYSLYLVQFAVFFYNVGIIRTSEEFKVVKSFDAGELVIILAASTMMTLLFDLPMQDIKGILMESGKRALEENNIPPRKKINCNNNNNNFHKLL